MTTPTDRTLTSLPQLLLIDVHSNLLFCGASGAHCHRYAAAALRVAAPRPVLSTCCGRAVAIDELPGGQSCRGGSADAFDWAVTFALFRRHDETGQLPCHVALTTPLALGSAPPTDGRGTSKQPIPCGRSSDVVQARVVRPRYVVKSAAAAAPAAFAVATDAASVAVLDRAGPCHVTVVPSSPDPIAVRHIALTAHTVDLSRCVELTVLNDFGAMAEALVQLHLPRSITSIGDAFCARTCALREMDLTSLTSLRSIGNYFLGLSEKLTRVVLPASVTSIGDHFCAHTPVREIYASRATSLTSIGDAFATQTPQLDRLYLPPSLTSLGAEFCSESGVRELDLSDCEGLTTIGGDFALCSEKLRMVALPASVPALPPGFCALSGVTVFDFSRCTMFQWLDNRVAESCRYLRRIELPASVQATTRIDIPGVAVDFQ